LSGEDIDELDLTMEEEQFQETVRRKLLGSMLNNGKNQRVVRLEEVESFLKRGWNYVAKLNDEKAVIKIP
ncbi:site-specific integrase, partial [Candidatus Bathyarchaeota archaeon]|nr:site-specific integrase [Candidatus Bathyarchaeota archaeon]